MGCDACMEGVGIGEINSLKKFKKIQGSLGLSKFNYISFMDPKLGS